MRSLLTRSIVLSFMALALVGLGACGKKAAGSGGDSTAAKTSDAGGDAAKNEAMAREFADKVFNQGDTAYVVSVLSPSYVDHEMTSEGEQGVAGFIKGMKEFRAGFPDLKVVVQDVICAGTKVVIRMTMSGTNSGLLMGAPATNKAISDVEIIDILNVVDGKVTEQWGQLDMTKFMTQLGMMPGSGGAPAGGGEHADAEHGDSAAQH